MAKVGKADLQELIRRAEQDKIKQEKEKKSANKASPQIAHPLGY
jgi:hypothetical protein